MIYFSSDEHFNNYNILKYQADTRPFNSVKEMNEELIKRWNSVVKHGDTVYVLGDFIMGVAEKTQDILDRLNGNIKLIRGNHDSRTKLKIYEANDIPIKELDYLEYKGRFFIMCHFPNENKEFIEMIRRDNSECIWLYGHLHGNAPKGYVNGTYHVGVDTNDLTPSSIEQIWQESWPDEMMTPEIADYKAKHEMDKIFDACM